MERREEKRFDTKLAVRVERASHPNSEERDGWIRDLSRKGALIQIPIAMPDADRVHITFKIPGQSATIDTEGEIRWRSDQEDRFCIGVKFDDLEPRDRTALGEFLPEENKKSLLEKATPSEFRKFKQKLVKELPLTASQENTLENLSPEDLYTHLVSMGVEEADVASSIAEFFNATYLAYVDEERVKTGEFSNEFCLDNHIVPINGNGVRQAFAVSNPFDRESRSVLFDFYEAGANDLFITEPSNIKGVLNGDAGTITEGGVEHVEDDDDSYVLKPESDDSPDDLEFDSHIAALSDTRTEDLEEASRKDYIIRLVNKLLVYGIRNEVSDIHIEPRNDELVVRFRIDGVLQNKWTLPEELASKVLARIKIMAKMDISERRNPQDGGFHVVFEGRQIDVRVSTIPLNFGEKAVLRILDKDRMPEDLSDLGFEEESLEQLEKSIREPQGLLYFTGPTGSGKTTTLYTCLRKINTPQVNIQTVEDPIEYNLEGLNQMEINPQAGLTFADALRGVLRQDPDVIMLGEIRDSETLTIALQAAMTGHLVLTTLHTNSAARTVDRLCSLGDDLFQVASSLELVIAQRLLRVLCEECKKPVDPHEHYRPENVRELEDVDKVFTEEGCTKCGETGYSGRVGTMEVLPGAEEVREAIQNRANTEALQKIMTEELAFNTLRENAMRKVARGLTSVEEVIRVVGR